MPRQILLPMSEFVDERDDILGHEQQLHIHLLLRLGHYVVFKFEILMIVPRLQAVQSCDHSCGDSDARQCPCSDGPFRFKVSTTTKCITCPRDNNISNYEDVSAVRPTSALFLTSITGLTTILDGFFQPAPSPAVCCPMSSRC